MTGPTTATRPHRSLGDSNYRSSPTDETSIDEPSPDPSLPGTSAP